MTKLPDSISSLANPVRRIPLKKIREDVVTLRTEYDEESLNELAGSMSKGQLQPVVVQQNDDDTFGLIIGSRRLRAAAKKGDRDILAYIIDKQAPVDLLLMALAENLHRKDLNPFEEAQGFLRLVKEYALGIKEVSQRIHKPTSYVRSRLELLSMPEEVKTLVSEQKLPLERVGVLARLPTGEEQTHFAQQAVTHHLSSSELRAEVARQREEPKPVPRSWDYELTSVKLRAKLEEHIDWLQKVPRRTNLKKINAAEKIALLKVLQNLEHEVRVLTAFFGGSSTTSDLSRSNIVSNHREVWTTRDIKRIHAKSRPSDEALAEELGRTVEAIRAMRNQTKEKA